MIDEVVILAAGLGSRMAEITKDRPKCMAPFQQGTLLSRLLVQLRAYEGIRRIHIVGGYRAEDLEEYVKHAEFAGLPIQVWRNDVYATTNSLISAKVAFEQARGQLLMFNSDVVYEAELVRRMVESEEPFAFSLDCSGYNEESEKLVLGTQGRVAAIAKTWKESEATGCSADLYRVRIEEGNNESLLRLLDRYLERPDAPRRLFEDFLDHFLLSHPFAAIDVTGLEWYEIDTVAELRDAEAIFQGIS